MRAYDAMLKRRSIRDFKNIDVKDEDIELLLKAAMSSPSAKNKMPWEFYVIKNKELQNKIKEEIPALNKNSNVHIIVCANLKDYEPTGPDDFFNQDCAAAVENILVEASELSLGSLWCGLYPRADRYKKLQELLNFDQTLIPFAYIHIGYPNEIKDSRTQYDVTKVHYYN